MRTVQIKIPARCLTGQAAANRFVDLLEGESPSHGFDYAPRGEFGYYFSVDIQKYVAFDNRRHSMSITICDDADEALECLFDEPEDLAA